MLTEPCGYLQEKYPRQSLWPCHDPEPELVQGGLEQGEDLEGHV